jgi:hypothetical protein
MRHTGLITVLPVLLNLCGCAGVVSLHPLVLPNDQNVVFDPALVGTWEEIVKPGEGPPERYIVARAESGYSIAVDAQQKAVMHLFKKDGRCLLDVYYPSPGIPPAAHLFLRLRLEQDTAFIAEIDAHRFREHLKRNGGLRHEIQAEDNDRVVLTASPAELRQQLLPYLAGEGAFGGEMKLKRIRE